MHGHLSDCQKHERAKAYLEGYKMWKTFDTAESQRADAAFSYARQGDLKSSN